MGKLQDGITDGLDVAIVKTRLYEMVETKLGPTGIVGLTTWGDLRAKLNERAPLEQQIEENELGLSVRTKLNGWHNDTERTVDGIFHNTTGVRFDFFDLTTLYFDLTETTMANPGDTIAVVKDKSGFRLHSKQPTVSFRSVVTQGATHPYLYLDAVDDVLPIQFPSGIVGQAFIAGLNRSFIVDVNIPANGTFNIGPDNIATELNVIGDLGGIVGIVVIGRNFTLKEKTWVSDFYADRGAAIMTIIDDSPANIWRITVNATQDTSQAGIGEIQMRATLGGADQTTAIDAATKATTSSEFSNFYAAANGFDDNISNFWTTATNNVPAWIQWDFGAPTTVRQISLACGEGAFNATIMPLEFTVSKSNDGVTFTDVYTAPTQTAWAEFQTRIYDLY